MNKSLLLLLIGFMAVVLAGCQPPTEIDIPVTIPAQVSPTIESFEPTPMPPEKTLIVCLKQEPESLYLYNQAFLYGGTGQEANTVLQAIYDGPFEILDEGISPVILASLPSFEAGTARFEAVEVSELEVYLNPETLQPDNLRRGDSFLPSGCHSPACKQEYEGGPVLMDRMVVEFGLRDAVTWSDGVPLTAGDSVYSYDLDRSGATPTTKYMVDRTHSYTAMDDLTVRWTGIPGYSDLEFETIFWHPLPRHILGDRNPGELQEHEGANRSPVGWGPYMIEQWVEGDRIEAVRNPFYFRGVEGFPYFDRVIYRFIGTDPRAALQQLLTTECDVLDENTLPQAIWPDLVEYQGEGRLQLVHRPASEVLRIDFNTAPVGRAGEAYFQTVEMRQAVAACLDREALAAQTMGGLATVANSFHVYSGLQRQDLPTLGFEPERGREMIRFLGWVDDDEDPTTSQSGWGVPGVNNGKRLELTMLLPEGDQWTGIAEAAQSMLNDCGIQVDLEAASAEDLTGGFADGLVFSRSFDLVLWSWPDWRTPLCEMFSTREIPSALNPFGVNASGYSNPDYDLSCDQLLLGDRAGIDEHSEAVQSIFLEQLPALPLLQPPRLLAAASDICGLSVDPFTSSLLWNLEAFARGEGCE